MKPLLLYSDLTNTWYVVTKYTVNDTHITAHIKHDVTDQMAAIVQSAGAEIERLRAALKKVQAEGAASSPHPVFDHCEVECESCAKKVAIADAALRGEQA